jgi:hypothetical protein
MLDIPGGNLVTLKYLITNDDYRQRVTRHIKDPVIRDYWEQDWSKLPERLRRERSLSTLNKLRTFISDPALRNTFGQQRSSIDFRRVLDGKQIFIANLDKGQLGRGKSQLLGALLVAKFYLAAITPPKHTDLPPYFLYIDEFQSFSTSTFEHILSEARGYGLGLTVAHQYIDQLSPAVLAALKGNVGNIVSFALGDDDAETMIRNLALDDALALVDLPAFCARIRTTNGVERFNITADMQPKLGRQSTKARRAIINNTRQKFASPRQRVEQDINRLIDYAQADLS